MLLLTNCTFDGVTYDAERVMEEVLAIKPDMCFLWDEAWYAFAVAVPFARQRTAMAAAQHLAAKLGSDEYRDHYTRHHADTQTEDPDIDSLVHQQLMPDPDLVRVRVYATHSTHKSLSALRQGSMIHIWDQDFDRISREQFGEAFLTHTSTSPNQQLIASLDLARRQVDLEGFGMVRQAYQMALTFRHQVSQDPLLRRWFDVLDVDDLIPAEYRPSGVTSSLARDDAHSWTGDEFVLDPTRVTLHIGRTGMNGAQFREKILMDRFGIQINKTSVNTVLLIFTIGVTWSSVQYLLDALRRTAGTLQGSADTAGRADQLAFQRRIRSLSSSALPPLPNFSEFAPAFRPSLTSPEGDIRRAFYAAYREHNREYVSLDDAVAAINAGRQLVSATFVVPYPPGFPVLVPGQILSEAILTFLINIDITEIHGYRPDLGLSVFTQNALDELAPSQPDRDPRTATASPADGTDRPDGPSLSPPPKTDPAINSRPAPRERRTRADTKSVHP